MKVVITDYEYTDIDQERKIILDSGAKFYAYQAKEENELIEITKDADAVIVQYANLTRNIIEKMEKCKVIATYGVGVNRIDIQAASDKGIYVCNVPDYGIDEVSNHTIALILALARKLHINAKCLKEGNWGYQNILPISRLERQTLGLIGLGRISSLVAKKMSAFGLNIIAYSPIGNEERANNLNVSLVDFETLLEKSDFISIHCPLTEETTHLFNKEVFSKMKNTAYIINTARGPIIDEEALIDALKLGEIAGAGLDVYKEEPIDNENELLKMDNVIATSHIAWYSQEAISALQQNPAKEVVNVLAGNEPFNCVNMKSLNKF